MQCQRVSIHASNIEERYRPHPTWVDENDKELEACPFAAEDGDQAKDFHELNELIETFLDRAPSDANAELRIHKTAEGYEAHFDVHSSQRSFGPVHQLGTKFRDVVENLVEEMRDEIEDWKSHRSLNVGDGL